MLFYIMEYSMFKIPNVQLLKQLQTTQQIADVLPSKNYTAFDLLL